MAAYTFLAGKREENFTAAVLTQKETKCCINSRLCLKGWGNPVHPISMAGNRNTEKSNYMMGNMEIYVFIVILCIHMFSETRWTATY